MLVGARVKAFVSVWMDLPKSLGDWNGEDLCILQNRRVDAHATVWAHAGMQTIGRQVHIIPAVLGR